MSVNFKKEIKKEVICVPKNSLKSGKEKKGTANIKK